MRMRRKMKMDLRLLTEKRWRWLLSWNMEELDVLCALAISQKTKGWGFLHHCYIPGAQGSDKV